ncbi:MAG: hypothetical protein KAS32_31080 [Candidatus Peribacteraceae bacterium]|nr:hypothetical protein [Candidatus Peribacteraceae bacterium]
MGYRNEYGKWFEETTTHKLPSNDVYSVGFGEYSGDFFVICGHGYGMSYIETPTVLSTRVVNNSNFTYPVRNMKTFSDVGGDVERIIYVGGYDLRARLGVMEDIASIKAGAFDDQTLFFHSDGMYDDKMNTGISSQWGLRGEDVVFSPTSNYTTISGVKIDSGTSTLLQKDLVPDQSFIASMKVKIDKWPERGNGGLHFGVTSGWPVIPILYEVTSQALSLSAINGVVGSVIEDEKFLIAPDKNNWKTTVYNRTNTQVLTESNVLKIHGEVSGSAGSGIFNITSLGHLRTFASKTFTAKVKIRCTGLDVSPEDARQSAVVFGISDGDYLGEGSGHHLLCMGLYSHFSNANPPVYAIGYTPTYGQLSWDTTTTLPTFTGDMTTSADWHTWEFTFNSSTETINAAVDGLFVGEYSYTAMGSDIGMFIGVGGNVFGGYITAEYKDFEIDFGENQPHAIREYVVQTYDNGTYSIPTISGTHLNGKTFSENDGTYSSAWRTWLLEYDGTTLSGSIDGQSAGAPVTLGLGNNNQRVFIHYDQPALVSGTSNERNVDIKIKDFTIEYTNSNAIIEGSPNNFWLEKGDYLGLSYNSLYIATSSGVQQLKYNESASVSGTPVSESSYGISGSQFGSCVLYGNIKNTSSVEVEPGAVGDNGLLYTGSSRYYPRGWERLIDRAGIVEVDDVKVGINVSPDGTRIYQFYNESGSYIYYIDTGIFSSSWVVFAQGNYPKELSAINQSRGYVFDMQDGHLYCVSSDWFGIFSKKDTIWLTPDINIGTGPVSFGGGPIREGEVAPIYARSALYLLYDGDPTFMTLSYREWTGMYSNSTSSELWSPFSIVVYSDVDDSIYAFIQGTSDNFRRMPLDTLVFSDPLEDCPFPYDFDFGISAFYRPYDESLYFVMKGASQEYGRRLLKYDVKLQAWSAWGEDFPADVYDYMTATYAFEEDAIYIIAGAGSTRMYKYYFPRDNAPRFVHWSSSKGVLPEESNIARFRKIAFNTEAGNNSDSFNDSSVSPQWFQNIYGTNGAITEDSNNINFVCDYSTQDSNTNLVRAIPVPACDFTATVKVKVNNMARSTGAAASSRNMFMFGITDFIGTPGMRTNTNEVRIGLSMVGMNGLFMVATNDESDDVNKYSLYKAELSSDTYYNTSQYQNFETEDATSTAEFKEWRVEYDHAAKQFDAYVEGTLIGTTTMTGDGFRHGASFYIGSQRVLAAVSGTLNVDVKDFEISVSGTTSLVSDYLEIKDDDEYGYQYYEKYDLTITSGTGYTFESDWRIDTYSLTDNEYITSVGSMEDGQKQAIIAVLYTGDKKVGIYLGGDPRLASSYNSVLHDWTVRSTYKIVCNTETIDLYLDGSGTSSINMSYGNLPDSRYRKCSFGSLNPDKSSFIWSSDRNGQVVTISGSWSHDYQESAFYGRNYSISTDSVDDKIVAYFNESSDGYLYMYYSVATSMSVAVPITVYHQGVLSTPSADSFATNPLVSVVDNEDEFGNADQNATKLVLSQERYADGSYYDRPIREPNEVPSGWVYLGKYSSINRVVVTTDGTGTGAGNYVNVDSFLIRHTDEQPRSRSVSRVYSVGYIKNENEIKDNSDYQGGFTVVDMYAKTQIDAYSDETTPPIIDGNVTDFDVIQ